MSVETGSSKTQETGVFPCKIEYGEQTADTLTAYRGDCGTCETPAEDGDQEIVKKHIGHAGGDDNIKPKFGLFCCYKKTLEHVLQHESRHGKERDMAVEHAAGKQLTLRPESDGNRTNDQKADRG